MTDYFQLPQCDDRADSTFPLKLKPKPEPLPGAKDAMDLAPLMRVFEKHPHIREVVLTALRSEDHGT